MSPKVRVENTSISISIMQEYKNITLSVDIMKVAGSPFLMTIPRHIKFGAAAKLDDLKNSHLLKHCKTLIGTCVTRGFKVTTIFADNHFEPMSGNLADLHAQLYITS